MADLFRRRAITSLTTAQQSRFWSAIYVYVFILAVFLCGQPHQKLELTWGWETLSTWIPSCVRYRERYWGNWGAILLVWSTSCSPLLQRIFTNGPVQYLGRIYFSLYLMHGPVVHTIGYGVMDVLWREIGDEGARKEFGFCVAAAISIASAIWIADIFMRVIDLPTVKFARWLEENWIEK